MLARPWVLAVWTLLLLVLQVSLTPLLLPASPRPDWMLVFAVLVGFMLGPRHGLTAGAAGGLLLDVVAGRFLGLNALIKALAGLVGGQLTRHVYRDNVIVALLGVAGSALGQELLVLLVFRALGVAVDPARAFYVLAPVLTANLVAAGVLYPLLLRQASNVPLPEWDAGAHRG